MTPIILTDRHLPPDVCAVCERQATGPELLCDCHICVECHPSFWGEMECVKTKEQQQANIKALNDKFRWRR